jgi:histidinol-phosphatase (PHP family)
MSWTNFHSHSNFCDGNETPEKSVEAAIKQKMPAFGLSSHAPVVFKTDWCLADEKLGEYLKSADDLKMLYKSKIQLYKGLEIDYIPEVAGRSKHLLTDVELDYFIGSIHFVDVVPDGTRWNIDHTSNFFEEGLEKIFNSSFEKASARFFELTQQMIEEDKPDIIGHLDKIKMYNVNNRYFSEEDFFYRKQIEHILSVIKKAGVIVEVNTRGFYRYGQQSLYPSKWILEKLAKYDIPVMLNSDSHKPEEISAGFDYAFDKLKGAGIKRLWALFDSKWRAFEYDREGLLL